MMLGSRPRPLRFAALAMACACACGSDTPASPDSCGDRCPAPHGLVWRCEERFAYGVNWAWGNWGGDFGGVSAWGSPGVASARDRFSADMRAMKDAGVSVIRWWMFPRFLTESITWGEDGAPSGIAGSLATDVEEALAVAEENDVYLMLTLFSFDSFGPTQEEGGATSRGIQPMVIDAVLRRKLIDNLVVPVARAVERSPHKQRMIAWDMVNEPEWAMTGPDLYGGEPYEPQSRLQSVTHQQMETFLKETAAALRASSGALITIGGAAIKWARAWSHVDVDFYQFHYYDWVHQWYPYATVTLAAAGVTDKPVVMGEFPIQGVSEIGGQPARTAAQLSADLWAAGYAGSLAWAFNDSAFPWSPGSVERFAAERPCETRF